jgi:hypothetical protein
LAIHLPAAAAAFLDTIPPIARLLQMERDCAQRFGSGWHSALTAAAAVTALACGQGEDLVAPLSGAVEVQVITEGSSPDADGYTLSFDDDGGIGVAATDTVLQELLQPGSHSVTLAGIASNCTLSGRNPLVVRVAVDDTAAVQFRVSCTADPGLGTLLAGISTSGSPPDEDGYSLAADPASPVPAGPNGDVIVPELSAGEHVVRLQGVADHCSVTGENPRTVAVPAGDTARTTFQVNCWPPLSGQIAFIGWRADDSFNRDLFLVRADGTGLIDLTVGLPDVFVTGPSFSLDGKHLVASLGGTIALVGTEINPATGVPSIRPIAEGECPVLSSDGSRLLYRANVEDGSEPPHRGIYLQDVGSSNARLILTGADTVFIGCPAWSPDDSRAAVPAELVSLQQVGVYIVPTAGGEPALMRLDPVREFIGLGISWSPSGEQLAFVLDAPEYQVQDIFVMDLDDATLVNLTRGRTGFTDEPSWSPDGTRLAYEGEHGLYLVNSDGTGLVQLTHDDDRLDGDPTWAPGQDRR